MSASTEQRVLDAIEAGRDELVALVTRLVAFDTTARDEDDPPRDEAALQRFLGDRLAAAGAAVDIWEPDPAAVALIAPIPPGLNFVGRPQARRDLPGRRQRAVAPPQRPHRRRHARADRPLDERPVAGRGPGRDPLRPRRLRHEGRRGGDDVRGGDAGAPRNPPRRRPDRQHQHRRGVLRRGLARLRGARHPRRRRHLHRADQGRHLGVHARLAVGDHHRGGASRARRDAAPAVARRRRRERDRRRRPDPRGDPPAPRRLADTDRPRTPIPLARDDPHHHDRGRRVVRVLPRLVPPEREHPLPAGLRRRGGARREHPARGGGLGARGRRHRPLARRASADVRVGSRISGRSTSATTIRSSRSSATPRVRRAAS